MMDFIIDCSVRAIGYHVYQAIWPNPYMGEPAVAVPGGTCMATLTISVYAAGFSDSRRCYRWSPTA